MCIRDSWKCSPNSEYRSGSQVELKYRPRVTYIPESGLYQITLVKLLRFILTFFIFGLSRGARKRRISRNESGETASKRRQVRVRSRGRQAVSYTHLRA